MLLFSMLFDLVYKIVVIELHGNGAQIVSNTGIHQLIVDLQHKTSYQGRIDLFFELDQRKAGRFFYLLYN